MLSEKNIIQESLQRMKLIMEYDISKTATENINEQVKKNVNEMGSVQGYNNQKTSDVPAPKETVVANTREQNIKNVLSKVGKDGIIHSPGSLVDNMKWDDYVSKYSITPEEINAAKGITREQNIKNVLSKVGKDGIIHSPGSLVDNMKWDDYVSKYSITPEEINAAKGITSGNTPNVGGSPANKTSIVIPKELKDTNGVMAFQNWLDGKYPQGWAERSNGTKYVTGGKPEMGYGRFGRNTARMWAKEGNFYIQELNSGKGELINKTPINTTLQNQTPAYGGPSAATTANLNALNAPSPAQPQVQPANPISDGKNLYDGLVARAADTQEPYITKSFGRIRYFGQPIQNFEALNSYITSLGYKQMKEKDGKVVWVKQ